jgi:hypothetical protein
MARHTTKEEKVAVKLTDLVSDVTLDLDEVGMYISRASPTVLINRLSIVVESAVDERENHDYTY